MPDRGIILLGAGGHAKVCIDIFQTCGQRVYCCIAQGDEQKSCMGIPIFDGDEKLEELYSQGLRQVFVAIGSNSVRQKLARRAIALGFHLVNAISPYAIVSTSAVLGVGVAVMPGAVINAEARIDDLAIINTGATVDHDCQIGQAAHIAPQCALAGSVSVGERSFLGVGCKVIPGIHIGDGCMAGAGSVIVRDVPSGKRVMGVPAR